MGCEGVLLEATSWKILGRARVVCCGVVAGCGCGVHGRQCGLAFVREREQASKYVRGLCAGCAVVEAPPQRMNWMVVTDACCRVRRGMHLCVTERVLALTYCVMFLLLVALRIGRQLWSAIGMDRWPIVAWRARVAGVVGASCALW